MSSALLHNNTEVGKEQERMVVARKTRITRYIGQIYVSYSPTILFCKCLKFLEVLKNVLNKLTGTQTGTKNK